MKNGLKNKKVLITCGPTWSAIDGVRVISNTSSGQMGRLLAERFKKEHARVTLLEGPVLKGCQQKEIKVYKFRYYDELAKLLKQELKKKVDIVVHAAAVSDYQVRKRYRDKLQSTRKNFSLQLIPTKKIINTIKRLAPKTKLVGFKLETNISKGTAPEKARKLFRDARCDLVVANSLQKGYRGFVLNKSCEVIAQANSRKGLSKVLVNRIKDIA